MLYNNPVLKTRRQELRKDQTETERIVWNIIRNKKCKSYKFLRQYSVGPYILDFYCPKLRLAIEIDGGQHSEKLRKQYDAERTNYLVGNNITEIRFWNSDVVENLQGVYQKILQIILEIEGKTAVRPS